MDGADFVPATEAWLDTMNVYNELDPFAADWIENLIAAGVIPPGHVDRRSIAELDGADLADATQVHLFAGVAGWSEALRLAGLPDDLRIWTGSCPCQPFSAAGTRKGTADERHLWPEMFRLVRECRPGIIVGEQVASAVGHGWLDGVFADLEGEGYACGAIVLGAHSVGAPHRRQRLFWCALADAERSRFQGCGIRGSAAATGQADGGGAAHRRAEAGRAWADFRVVHCRDGKCRRVSAQSGDEPLAHGIPRDMGRRVPELAGVVRGARANRVGRLKGYGNAIVPPVAAVFLRAVLCGE